MNRLNRRALCVLVGVLALLAGSVWSEPLQPSQITTWGESEVLLEPDYVEWVVLIQSQDKLPKLARAVNDEILESLLDIADQYDIDEEDISSGEPAYDQVFRDRDRGDTQISDYLATKVSRRVALVMREMDGADEMLEAVHSLGVIYVIRRKSTRYDEEVRRVKAQALKRARINAEEQAAALGQTIGKAILAEVYIRDNNNSEGGLFGPPDDPIEPDKSAADARGKIRIQAYADVSFLLE